jgi:NTP pyrophosphatase (non-canonical NTP hydrolase)
MDKIAFMNIINLIAIELDRAEEKFPTFPEDPVHAAAVVAEESGELQRAALQYTYESGAIKAMRTEAIHTAVTAIRFLANIHNMKAQPSLQIKE